MDNRKYILYAEDDIDDREIFAEAFHDFPEFHLETFTNGAELLRFLDGGVATEQVCLIILDINMPILTGVETLEGLKADQRYNEIPVVLFSTAGSPSEKKAAEDAATEIVLKPSTYKSIKSTMEFLLQNCNQSQLFT